MMNKYVNGNIIEMTPEELEEMQIQSEKYLESNEYRQMQISDFKQKLSDTDYVACKIAEGVATREEYSGLLLQRQEWREEINRLELEISQNEEDIPSDNLSDDENGDLGSLESTEDMLSDNSSIEDENNSGNKDSIEIEGI